jgi:hypothetical protein
MGFRTLPRYLTSDSSLDSSLCLGDKGFVVFLSPSSHSPYFALFSLNLKEGSHVLCLAPPHIKPLYKRVKKDKVSLLLFPLNCTVVLITVAL